GEQAGAVRAREDHAEQLAGHLAVEGAEALGVAGRLAQQLHEDELPPLGRGADLRDELLDLDDELVGEGLEDAVLVAEVVEEGGARDVELVGDLADGGLAVAPLPEEP